MISTKMKKFMESTGRAIVASADALGNPHLAVGQDLRVVDPDHLVFEAWFCPKTLENVSGNPKVAIAVTDPSSGMGFQLAGVVENTSEVGILNGYVPGVEEPGTPQVESRLVVRIIRLMEFSPGAHTDRAISID
jgi:hypothetical protein